MANQRSYNPGYTGIPALYFLESLHQNRGEKKLIDRMWSLHAQFSYLNGWLYDPDDNLRKGIPPEVGLKMDRLRPEIDAMFHTYEGVYEGDICSVEEKKFMLVLCKIRERIDAIAAASGIIDKIAATPEELVF